MIQQGIERILVAAIHAVRLLLAVLALVQKLGAASSALLPAKPYDATSNGGFFGREVHVPPVGPRGQKPHIVFVLLDDWGWGNAGWNNPAVAEQTPTLSALVKTGIELERHYVFKCGMLNSIAPAPA
eukprot:SAG31_NODE_9501_length_1267_cov_2.899829_2_plen_127_part_00